MNKFYSVLEGTKPDPHKIAFYQKKQKAVKSDNKEYLIAITPRSGSSLLTELLSATNVAGNPEEWFNPSNLQGILENCPCNNIDDYLTFLKTAQTTSNGIFGAEASFFQLRLVLAEIKFRTLFPASNFSCIYLSRKDFIRQGISLYKAVASGFFHAFQHGKNKDNSQVDYSSEEVKKWIVHILHQEAHWEQFFIQNKLSPMRIYYEDLTSDYRDVVSQVLSYLDIECSVEMPTAVKNKKISDKSSELYYDRILAEETEFIQKCRDRRYKSEILNLRVQ